MTKAVYKFPLYVDLQQHVYMSEQSEILSLQLQDGIPTLWALVEIEVTAKNYVFYMLGTGHPMTDEWFEDKEYVGTIQLNGMVWHYWRG